MSKRQLSFIAVTALLVVSSVAFAAATPGNPCNPCSMKGATFHVNDPMGRNTVTFKSEAPLEDIVGTIVPEVLTRRGGDGLQPRAGLDQQSVVEQFDEPRRSGDRAAPTEPAGRKVEALDARHARLGHVDALADH